MTNEQMLVVKIAERQILVAAIEAARDELRESNAARREEHKSSPYGIPSVQCIISKRCPEDHYRLGEYHALLPFLEILESIDEAITILRVDSKISENSKGRAD